jgi:hypothetical protein
MSQGGNSRKGSGGGSGTVTNLQGDTGGPVPPTTGIIHVSGASTTFVIGNPGASNLDVEVVSSPHTFLQGAGPTTASVPLGPLNNGQLIIGATGSPAAAANLTAGTGISIVNAANSITISSTGSAISLNRQVFTTSGTYTPTANIVAADVEVQAGGGGGAGCAPVTSGAVAGAGGGAGGYQRAIIQSASLLPSVAVTVGTGGSGGSNVSSPGDGNPSSFGALITTTGGGNGSIPTGTVTPGVNSSAPAASGGSGSGGDYGINGQAGGTSCMIGVTGSGQMAISGAGGNSFLGLGGRQLTTTGATGVNSLPGVNGSGYGSGGSGASQSGTVATPALGGNGANGIVIVTEYISTSGSSPSFPWVVISSDVSLSPQHGYIVRGGTLNLAMPVTMALGQIIEIAGQTGSWSLSLNGGQSIIFNSNTATTSITSTHATDCLRIVCTNANTVFEVLSVEGNPTIV